MIPKFLIAFLFLVASTGFCQRTELGGDIGWDNLKPVVADSVRKKHANDDLIMVYERSEFIFYSKSNEKLYRYCRYLVNSLNGVKKLEQRQLPESFDPAFDKGHNQQGRRSQIKIPFIYEYSLKKFGARVYRNNRWTKLAFNTTTTPVKWIKAAGDRAGEFVKDDAMNFELIGLQPGDIVDVYYESDFSAHYGSNNFYMNSDIPKVRCDFIFSYLVDKRFSGLAFLFPNNITKEETSMRSEPSADHDTHIYTYTVNDLKAINYPNNSFQGRKLKYVFADFSYYRVLGNTYPDEGRRLYEVDLFRPSNFQWVTLVDSTNHFTKIYDKQFASIRKFLGRLPSPRENDSSYFRFFSALCDTLGTYRYITSNSLFYGESQLYDVYSGDHLLKHRLVQHQQWKLYRDILNESKIFYYLVNVQDRRLGEHYIDANVNHAYQYHLVAVPYKKSFLYFMPRYGGIKYHLGELPFYLEGSVASMEPRNFQENDSLSRTNRRFIRTHRGTHEENTRVENARVKISIDSSLVRVTAKENLSGQFSTVLRHLYLKEYIDSSIAGHYFKRCVDKPGAKNQTIKLSSRSTTYPFRYNFNCSYSLDQHLKSDVNLTNWFSFPISRQVLPELPTHDFYFDYEFTDVYNFALEFDQKVKVLNTEAISQSIQNEYFAFESSLKETGEAAYLLSVRLSVKRPSIPIHEMKKMEEILNGLDKINNLQLKLGSKEM